MVIETRKGTPNVMSATVAGVVAWTVSSIGAFSCEEAEENAVLRHPGELLRSLEIVLLELVRTWTRITFGMPGLAFCSDQVAVLGFGRVTGRSR